MAIWHVAQLRFDPAFWALGVCEHIWLRYKHFDPSFFDPIQKFGMSTWGLYLIIDPFPSTYFRPPIKGVRSIRSKERDRKRVRDISSPAIWAAIWRRSHGRQKCRPNGLIKLINWLICLKKLAHLLYGSVAPLPSPSSNIEAWPYGTSLRFASLLHLWH